MITTTSPSFYTIRASGEAAELITSAFSPGSMCDIINVVVLSKDFTNDIEPMNELRATINTIKDGLGKDVIQSVSMNPLFIPMPIEDLDEALDVEQKSDNIRFTAMNGDPFAVKIVELLNLNEELLLTGVVSYQQFDLPGYETIMANQRNTYLN